MTGWFWTLVGLALLLGSISACGGSTTSAAATAQQMVDALAAQDTATVTKLADPAMPLRDLALGDELRRWRDRMELPEAGAYFYPALGPVVSTELQPAEQQRATTVINHPLKQVACT
jgi:hypothetical protein